MAEDKIKKELNINDYEMAAFTNTYTTEMLKDISKHSNAITTALNSIAKNYEKVIFNLYWIYKTKSYISFGYDSIITYASEKFGFKKSSTYDFITLAERFGNDDFTAFDAKYKDYEHSKLSLIADKSDIEIESLELKPDMSVKEIKALVKKHDSSNKSIQDSVDNESGSDSKKPDSQESLVINDNEVSLPESDDSFSLSILDYEAYKPNKFYDLKKYEYVSWSDDCYIYDYIDNHMNLINDYITYDDGRNGILDVESNSKHYAYKAVFFDDRKLVRFFVGGFVVDITLERLEYEKRLRNGYLVTVYQNEKEVESVKFKTLGSSLSDYFIKYSDCKITITLNNSNENEKKGGKDT